MSISQARSISDALRVDWQRLCVLSTTDHPDEGENFMNSQDLTERIVVISVALMQATTRHEELVTQLQSLSQTKVTHSSTPSTIGATLPTQISHGDTCQHAATLPTWNSHGVPQSHEASPAEISHGGYSVPTRRGPTGIIAFCVPHGPTNGQRAGRAHGWISSPSVCGSGVPPRLVHTSCLRRTPVLLLRSRPAVRQAGRGSGGGDPALIATRALNDERGRQARV